MAGSRTECHRAPPLSGLDWLDLARGDCPWRYQEAEDSSCPAPPQHPPALHLQGGGGAQAPGGAAAWVLLQGARVLRCLVLSRRAALQDWIQEHCNFLVSSAYYSTASSAVRPHELASPENMEIEQSLLCLPIDPSSITLTERARFTFCFFIFPEVIVSSPSRHIHFDCRLKVSAEVKMKKKANYSSGINKCINNIWYKTHRVLRCSN